MRTQLAQRLRSSSQSLTAIPPPQSSEDYSVFLANLAAHILYRSPLPSQSDLPIFILNAAAFPDAKEVSYDALLPYVLARLPDEEELIGGQGYEVVFFAGGGSNSAGDRKKSRPGWGWCLQAYHVLTRATRKRLQKLYIVHEKQWIRMLIEMFSTVGSPKFRKKVVHVSTLSQLALRIPIEDLLIPPSAYLQDRRLEKSVFAPYCTGRRAFGVKHPLPHASSGNGELRLPRVLREATSFVLMDPLVKTEGLFRINARALTVDIVKEAYDRGQKFVVWREGDAVLTFRHYKEGVGNVWIDEIEAAEGYELSTAGALIKHWYKELAEAIFPQSCYQALHKFYGNPEEKLDPEQLIEMLSPSSDWTILSRSARNILRMHLLPLLSRITEFQDWNHMTAYNLAVCFAPTLLSSPDPIEDARMSTIIRRILEAMIVMWKQYLAPAFQTDHAAFEDSLRVPEAIADREDPLDHKAGTASSDDAQISGITLIDNDASDEDPEEERPPLPPRPRRSTVAGVPNAPSPNSSSPSPTDGVTTALKRKPAPTVQPLPRYSMVVGGQQPLATLEHIPFYNTVDPVEEPEDMVVDPELPGYEDPSSSSWVPRKPLPISKEATKG